LAHASAAAPLLQLAKIGSSSSSRSSNWDSMSVQLDALHLLGLLLEHGQQPALHELVVRAGAIELAVQLVLQAEQQNQQKQEEQQQQQQQQQQNQ
jgi:hypothetical protein